MAVSVLVKHANGSIPLGLLVSMIEAMIAQFSAPAGDFNIGTDTVGCDQLVISGVTIELKDARQPLQYPFGMLPAATWSIGRGHTPWCTSAPWSVITGQRREEMTSSRSDTPHRCNDGLRRKHKSGFPLRYLVKTVAVSWAHASAGNLLRLSEVSCNHDVLSTRV